MYSENPKILFIRPEYGSGFSRMINLCTEPLDLEYLAAAANMEQCEYRIFDPSVTGEKFKDVLNEFRPDIVGITGCYPARDNMIKLAQDVKNIKPDTLTVIGGVHAEINYSDFYCDACDLIVYSGGVFTFKKIIQAVKGDDSLSCIKGLCYRDSQNSWKCNSKVSFDPNQLPVPDRSHFNRYKNKFTYMYYGPVALVKTAYGCPFECSFCYCRLLNYGHYTCRDVNAVADEISEIECSTIWITDDSFLLEMDRIKSFVEALRIKGVQKKFIIYSRAPFIARNPEVVPLLKEMGVINVITGLESVDEKKLGNFNKAAHASENEECIRLLKAGEIECTGLFIMNTDAKLSDFKKLNKWIDKTGLRLFTVSIFTPFPGTPGFESYKNQLTTDDCKKWDLLHLVLKPENINRFIFYLLLFSTHLKVLFKNRDMRKFLFFRKEAGK